MSQLYKILLFILLFCIPILIISQTGQQQKINRANNVLILPFIENEKYPYASDEIRFSLITGFLQKGYNVIEDDTVWYELINTDFNLWNISTEIADSISKYVKTDLIVYGKIDEVINTRETGLSNKRLVYKPILIKIYDTRKKSIIFFERINLIEYWGMFENVTSISEIGLKIATTLRNRGY